MLLVAVAGSTLAFSSSGKELGLEFWVGAILAISDELGLGLVGPWIDSLTNKLLAEMGVPTQKYIYSLLREREGGATQSNVDKQVDALR
ncbi:LOW QUALITY PROTEIN: hypothetical protein NC653_030901 [Populus alba x Populus x berolinensis]|uniref:Uncharacterized protein n=1 Tax=Populus alba x Populus x berolinensis TaxID=444605 RepID=A0AAD6LZY5_9ROSI|nr:LOW QUALITY PROTEIN: hypothetical protein NC653_030901 [Populus alba x Populus x berolinensis]